MIGTCTLDLCQRTILVLLLKYNEELLGKKVLFRQVNREKASESLILLT